MERRNARQTREIVVPGDVLDGTGMKPGDYAYVQGGKVRASVMGVRNVFQNTVGVIPLRGCYMPTSGDTVIGVIVDIGPSNWLVDIGAPYPAPLHVNEVPWKVEFGDTSRYLGMGNVVLLKVLSVDESDFIESRAAFSIYTMALFLVYMPQSSFVASTPSGRESTL